MQTPYTDAQGLESTCVYMHQSFARARVGLERELSLKGSEVLWSTVAEVNAKEKIPNSKRSAAAVVESSVALFGYQGCFRFTATNQEHLGFSPLSQVLCVMDLGHLRAYMHCTPTCKHGAWPYFNENAQGPMSHDLHTPARNVNICTHNSEMLTSAPTVESTLDTPLLRV